MYRFLLLLILIMMTTSGANAQTGAERYARVPLTTDLSVLTAGDRAALRPLLEAAEITNRIFAQQAYGNLDSLLASADEQFRPMVAINYGPWDRIGGNEPFLPGVGPKPAGANLYPNDLTVEELDAAAKQNAELKSPYTVVRRDATGRLVAVPYHQAYREEVSAIAARLEEAAALTTNEAFRNYLRLRAKAILTDDYRASDFAWMDMKDNVLDIVIGPIENYEDRLMGAKAAYEGIVLVKDLAWSERLARYAKLLPQLQRGLPVPDAYKQETPGTDSDLYAYDAVFYAGDANAGSKTIAINLPNDEEVQLARGTRRLQLKNVMRAKFETILVPIADVLIAPEQRRHIKFDAFFGDVMFHEVAHGLGIKNTITGKGTAREALKDLYSALEEGKADVLGLYMVRQLAADGHYETDLHDDYVTFLAGMFRSIRFGASSAHGRANLVRFNYFEEQGAFVRDAATGTYRVDFDRIGPAVDSLSEVILKLQGDGDYAAAEAFEKKYGILTPQLKADLERLQGGGIPVDIVFEQGPAVLGL